MQGGEGNNHLVRTKVTMGTARGFRTAFANVISVLTPS